MAQKMLRRATSSAVRRAATVLPILTAVLAFTGLGLTRGRNLYARLAAQPPPFAQHASKRVGRAAKVLGAWYIRIATAAVEKDNTSLQRYAEKMQAFAGDRSRPFLRLPALRALTFIYFELRRWHACQESFVLLCESGDEPIRYPELQKFALMLFHRAARQGHEAWVAQVVRAALPGLRPPFGRFYLFLLRKRLSEVKSPASQLALIHEAIVVERAWDRRVAAASRTAKPRADMRRLRFTAVRIDAEIPDTSRLQRDATEYLERYGAGEKYSPLVLLYSEQALVLAYLEAADASKKVGVADSASWLKAWYPKIVPRAGALSGQIRRYWLRWQSVTAPARQRTGAVRRAVK